MHFERWIRIVEGRILTDRDHAEAEWFAAELNVPAVDAEVARSEDRRFEIDIGGLEAQKRVPAPKAVNNGAGNIDVERIAAG